MKNTLLKIAKERKVVYICGDFNINLLKYVNDTAVQYCYKLVTSNGLLRTYHFTNQINRLYNVNNLQYIFSANDNIIIEMSDHLSSYLIYGYIKNRI